MTQAPHLENGIAAEVPDDVRKLAEEAAIAWYGDPGAGRTIGVIAMKARFEQAIMADRASRPVQHDGRREVLEEAAEIAEDVSDVTVEGTACGKSYLFGRRDAAAAIRSHAALREPTPLPILKAKNVTKDKPAVARRLKRDAAGLRANKFHISGALLMEEAARVIEEADQALRPFAEYYADGGDRDNHGQPFPDDHGVGWVYLTVGDFRRARAARSRITTGQEGGGET